MIFENFAYFMNRIVLFSSFVNQAEGFPKPLNIDDEKLCFELMKNGDKNAKDKLISHNLRLVAHIVKKYSGAYEADDLISVGSIGLIKAINTFEYGKGTQLSTYAARCIENEILMLLRVSKKHKAVISVSDTYVQDKDGNEMEYLEIIPSEIDIFEEVQNKVLTEKILKVVENKLSKREAEIIKFRYGLNNTPALTQREVAKKLNISRSYISRLETKALSLLKTELSEYDEKNKNNY